MTFLVIAFLLALVYMAIQLQYIYYWKKIKSTVVPEPYVPTQPVSIIIVVRNEEETITKCLQGILSQNYPRHLVEIILIDDHSEDHTVSSILSLQDERIQLLRLQHYPEFIHPPAFKKSAITLGVSKATSDIIVVTDSDCQHSPEWLKTVVFAMEKEHSVFQASPVVLIPGKSWLEKMQEMEMLAFMLITGSGIRSRLHDMANGANMAFRKSTFQSVNGYEGNYQYASGDDMFLIEKMHVAFPDKIHFTKSNDAIAWTYGKTNWKNLIKQRLRWASKNQGLRNKKILVLWGLVGLVHVSLLLFFLLALFQIIRWNPFLILLSSKWAADYFVIQQSASFFNRFSVLRNFIISQLLYSWYVLLIGYHIILSKKGDWNR